MQQAGPRHPSFGEALLFWLKLGFISFGGPTGQIAIMHEYLVEKKKWISESKFLHALNYCMILPGPEAQQLATYNGWLLHGTRGGIAAGLLFILPSVFILWGLSLVYVTYGQLPVINSVFELLKPAVIAIVIMALIKIAKKSLLSPVYTIIATLSFCFLFFLNVPFLVIIFGALVTGVICVRYFPQLLQTDQTRQEIQNQDEATYVINQDTVISGIGFSWSGLMIQVTMSLLLWVTPLLILYASNTNGFHFWKQLSFFFTKAAFVTIGGAYAILPYVAQTSVESYGWLTKYQMIDGLALGETTPGPLIMVLAFVGFMAGYNFFGGKLGMATLGLGLTTYYTFLPSFLFILAGAPLIEKTQTNPYFKTIFGFATAAVTGVILNLCIYFVKAVILPAPEVILWIPLIWVVISFIALKFFKVNMILWIGLCIVMGVIRYYLQIY